MAEPAAKKRRLSPARENGSSVPGFANYDLEEDYVQRLAKKNKKNDKPEKLMIKTDQGLVENPRVQLEEEEPGSEEDGPFADGKEDEDSAVADLVPRQKKAKVTLPPREQIRQAQEELARIAGLISENPEDHIGQLGGLAEIARSQNLTVKKLALATQLAVYKNIIPGYRIRPLSRDDAQAKVSKEVKKLRSFEQGLLGGYKDYVQTLSKLASEKNRRDDGLAGVAISCASALLAHVAHFNCRNELITILVRKLAGRKLDAEFAKCREALEQLFRDDEEGRASLEAVSQLTRMLKARSYNVHESVLNLFLHLRLLNEFAHKASTNSVDKDTDETNDHGKKPKQKREFRTKKERKIMKERKQVAKEMKEADASVSFEERDKSQAEMLKLVFVAYFRILKERIPHLMGAVLEGLAKYSHLINQDFFGDVLEALKDLIREAEAALEPQEGNEDEEDATDDDNDDHVEAAEHRNAIRERLLCVITAFALLQGQHDVVKSANSLHLDLSFFITHLYRILIPLSVDLDIELGARSSAHLADPNGLHTPQPATTDTKVNVATTTVLLLRSLQSVLLPPTATRSVPPSRVAAFVKQLSMLALHLPPKSALATLELLRQVTKTHGTKVSALWHTEERKGDGVFDARSLEVESSNPFATTVWEGELLKLHFDPKVRASVVEIERNVKAARS